MPRPLSMYSDKPSGRLTASLSIALLNKQPIHFCQRSKDYRICQPNTGYSGSVEYCSTAVTVPRVHFQLTLFRRWFFGSSYLYQASDGLPKHPPPPHNLFVYFLHRYRCNTPISLERWNSPVYPLQSEFFFLILLQIYRYL